jgi:hypothetical protein
MSGTSWSTLQQTLLVCSESSRWPPCSDSEEDFSEPEDDSDFDEVNSPPAARPKARSQLPLFRSILFSDTFR